MCTPFCTPAGTMSVDLPSLLCLLECDHNCMNDIEQSDAFNGCSHGLHTVYDRPLPSLHFSLPPSLPPFLPPSPPTEYFHSSSRKKQGPSNEKVDPLLPLVIVSMMSYVVTVDSVCQLKAMDSTKIGRSSGRQSRSGMVLVYIVPVVTRVLSVFQSDSDTKNRATITTRDPNGDMRQSTIIHLASVLPYSV